MQEADSVSTAPSKGGKTVGKVRGPRATTAVGVAVVDGETDPSDRLVLQNVMLLREQLDNLAKSIEHNQRSLLEAMGVFPANSHPSAPGSAFPDSSRGPALRTPAGTPARARLRTVVDDGDANSPLTPVSPGYPEVSDADGPRFSPASADEDSIGGQDLEWTVDVEDVQLAAVEKPMGGQSGVLEKNMHLRSNTCSSGPSMGTRSATMNEVEVHELSKFNAELIVSTSSIKNSRRHMTYGQGQHRREIKAWAVRVSKTSHFETAVAVSILSNAILIGWNSDWSIKNLGAERPIAFKALDWIFLVIFALELVLRMAAEGHTFLQCRNKMFGWNVFDGFIIALALLNNADVLSVRLSVVRVFRVLRLVHVIRLIRLKSGFRELRMMVDGIMNCGKTLLWSFLLLIVITFIYAVMCLEFIAEWLTEAEQEPTSASVGLGQAERETKMSTINFVKDNYASLHYSIYTLFKAVSGGVSWGELSDPMERVNIVLVLTFPLFIGVTVFCVLNIVTAAFVDAAARTSKEEEADALEYISERKTWIRTVSNIFKRHDADSCGALDFDEFSSIMTDWRTQTAFQGMGIDMSFQQAKVLFKLFDWDGDGLIDINEFAQGVHHLKGPARSLDVLRHFMKLSRQIDQLAKSLQHDKSDPHPVASRNSYASTMSYQSLGARC